MKMETKDMIKPNLFIIITLSWLLVSYIIYILYIIYKTNLEFILIIIKKYSMPKERVYARITFDNIFIYIMRL